MMIPPPQEWCKQVSGSLIDKNDRVRIPDVWSPSHDSASDTIIATHSPVDNIIKKGHFHRKDRIDQKEIIASFDKALKRRSLQVQGMKLPT
jgi:hypothetical protein